MTPPMPRLHLLPQIVPLPRESLHLLMLLQLLLLLVPMQLLLVLQW